MKKVLFNLSSFLILSTLSACSSALRDSQFDQTMRMHGTYLCPAVVANTDAKNKKILNESVAAKDITRIRCYQDQWTIDGSDQKLTRTYFQSEHCDGPIAKIEFQKKGKAVARCQLEKTSVSWLAEDDGVCFLRDLAPNVPTSIQALAKCNRHLPPPCLNPQSEVRMDSTAGRDEGVSEDIRVTSAGNYLANCKRYLK